MKITDRIQQHWLGWVVTIGAITASVTWIVANEVLVKPRDFEISRLNEEIVDLKQQVKSLKNESQFKVKTLPNTSTYSSSRNNIEASNANQQDIKIDIKITMPSQSVVNNTTQIEGFVSDPKEEVYLLVRPENSSEFWVQPQAIVKDDGSWIADIHLSPGIKATGQRYQVYAIAGPKVELPLGTALQELPASSGVSQPIEIQNR